MKLHGIERLLFAEHAVVVPEDQEDGLFIKRTTSKEGWPRLLSGTALLFKVTDEEIQAVYDGQQEEVLARHFRADGSRPGAFSVSEEHSQGELGDPVIMHSGSRHHGLSRPLLQLSPLDTVVEVAPQPIHLPMPTRQ